MSFHPEAYSESCQTSKKVLLAKMVNGFQRICTCMQISLGYRGLIEERHILSNAFFISNKIFQPSFSIVWGVFLTLGLSAAYLLRNNFLPDNSKWSKHSLTNTCSFQFVKLSCFIYRNNKIRCSSKFCKSHRKTPVPGSLF